MTLYPGDLGNGERLTNQVSLGAPPDRRPRSLRRTSTMVCTWPAGATVILGRGRDLYTDVDVQSPRVWGSDEAVIAIKSGRIESIEGPRLQAELASFAGLRPSRELREGMAKTIPDEMSRSTILHRLLDDAAGTNFMATGAWFQWLPGGISEYERLAGIRPLLERNVEGVCISFQVGSPSLKDGQTNEDLANHPHLGLPFRADDPFAWHAFPPLEGPNHWRIRHMDLWRERDGLLHASAGFQDASALPHRTDERLIFHEYRLSATIDPDGLRLRDIEVTPGVLPFRTCHAAPAGAKHLIGESISDFRRLVPDVLAGGRGCTHLNEVLRAFQDIESLAASLTAIEGPIP